MRTLLLSLALLAAVPASASATLGQVEPLTLRANSECVGPTGMPGEIAVPTMDGVRFVQATREGLKPGATVSLGGESYDCPSVVTRPTGAGVIAGRAPGSNGVVVVVRDPGGGWSAPVTIPLENRRNAEQIGADVSDRGDVLVTWRESGRTKKEGFRFRAVRRAPGAALGTPETLGTPLRRAELVLPAIAATGEAFALTTVVEGDKPPFRAPVSVASAAPGAPFGAPAKIADMTWLSLPALVATADGRVLVAVPGADALQVAERLPGGTFGPATPVARNEGGSWAYASATLRADGAAAVGWIRALRGDAQIVTRAPGGAFGAPQSAAGGGLVPDGFPSVFLSQAFLATLLGADGGLTFSSTLIGTTALSLDGRALLAWYGREAAPTTPTLLSTPLTGGPLTRQSGGRGLITPSSFPVVLPDGAAGLAWVESDTSALRSSAAITLRFAAEGVTAGPAPAPPRVTVGAPRSRVLGENSSLRLPVRCSGPCEVRGSIAAGLADFADVVRLPRGGRGTLAIRGAAIGLPGPRGHVKVRLAYRAPDGVEAKARTLRIAARKPAGSADTRVRKLRAVRRGGSIRVTWTIAGRPGDDASFIVTSAATRDRFAEPATFTIVDGRKGRRTFATTLAPDADVRWVTVYSTESIASGGPAYARVR